MSKLSRIIMALILLVVIFACLAALSPLIIEKTNKLLFDNTLKHNVAVFSSILGLWLTGASFVGKGRLERWQATINTKMEGKKLVLWAGNTESGIRSLLEKTFIRFIYVVLIATIMMFIVSQINDGGGKVPEIIQTPIIYITITSCGFEILLFGIFLAHPFVPFLLLLLIQITILPYRFIRLLDNDASLERTLLFVGLILGTIGIVLLL